MPDPKAPTKRAEPKRQPVTKAMCAGLIDFIDIGWTLSPFREDKLSDTEKAALTNSFYNTAKANVYVGNIIYNVMTGAAETQLVVCVGAIALVRLARHKVVPEMIEYPAWAILTKLAGEELEETPPVAEAPNVEAGGARGPDRVNGNGQDNAPGGIGDDAALFADAPNQVGYASLAEVQSDPQRGANGLSEVRPRRKRETYSEMLAREQAARVSRGDSEGV